MFLYLTSAASKTLDNLIKFLPKNPNSMKVAFIPTAGDIYKDTPWIEGDKSKLVELGFQVKVVDIKNQTLENLKTEFDGIDIIFVAGGNTIYLLEQMQKSNCLSLIREKVLNGTIYIGSSAGSLLAGPNIEIEKDEDDKDYDVELESYEALNLVDFIIMPHANNEAYIPLIQKIIDKYKNKYSFKIIKDNQAIAVNDKEIKLIEV